MLTKKLPQRFQCLMELSKEKIVSFFLKNLEKKIFLQENPIPPPDNLFIFWLVKEAKFKKLF